MHTTHTSYSICRKKYCKSFNIMSLTVPIAEWLEGSAGKQGIAGSIPCEGIHNHFGFSLTERCLHLGEDYTNEIKHDIHPEKWVNSDRFNIKTNMAAVYITTGQL